MSKSRDFRLITLRSSIKSNSDTEENVWSSNEELENDPQNPLLLEVMNLLSETEETPSAFLSPVRKAPDSGCPSSEIMSPETNFGTNHLYNVQPRFQDSKLMLMSYQPNNKQYIGSNSPLGLLNHSSEYSGHHNGFSSQYSPNTATPIKEGMKQNSKSNVLFEPISRIQMPPPLVYNFPPPQISQDWNSNCKYIMRTRNVRPINSTCSNNFMQTSVSKSQFDNRSSAQYQQSSLMLLNQGLRNLNLLSGSTASTQEKTAPHVKGTMNSMINSVTTNSIDLTLRLDQQIEAAKDIRYKTQMCIHFQRYGECPRVTRCRFAHGLPEMRLASSHPKYRTLHCIHYVRSGGKHCPFGGVNPIAQHPLVSAQRARLSAPTPIH